MYVINRTLFHYVCMYLMGSCPISCVCLYQEPVPLYLTRLLLFPKLGLKVIQGSIRSVDWFYANNPVVIFNMLPCTHICLFLIPFSLCKTKFSPCGGTKLLVLLLIHHSLVPPPNIHLPFCSCNSETLRLFHHTRVYSLYFHFN